MRSISLLLMRKKSLLRDVASACHAWMPRFLLLEFSQFPVTTFYRAPCPASSVAPHSRQASTYLPPKSDTLP